MGYGPPPIPPMLGSPVCICSSTLGGGEGAHVILELDHPPGHQNPPLELSSYLLARPTVLEDCWKCLLQVFCVVLLQG